MNNKSYKSRDWLYFHYWMMGMSKQKIADYCNTTLFTIRYWTKKLEVISRSISDANHLARGNHVQLSKEAREWLDGELLGDGNLFSQSPFSARICYSSKYSEYIYYVSKILAFFDIYQLGKILEKIEEAGNLIFRYQSKNYAELLSIYKRWYPEGKKIVPRDLELTPLVCRQWYIGDGHLRQSKRGRKSIDLKTTGFPIEDVEWLVEYLNILNIKCTREPSHNLIHISTFSTKDFLEYIGPCSIECYQYKWDYTKGGYK